MFCILYSFFFTVECFVLRYGLKEKTDLAWKSSTSTPKELMEISKLSFLTHDFADEKSENHERKDVLSVLTTCSLKTALVVLERGYHYCLKRDRKSSVALMKAFLMNLSYVYLKFNDYRLTIYYGNHYNKLEGKKRYDCSICRFCVYSAFSVIVANYIAEAFYCLGRLDECEKVLSSAMVDLNAVTTEELDSNNSAAAISDGYVYSSSYLQCQQAKNIERCVTLTNLSIAGTVHRGSCDVGLLEQIIKQFPRLAPAWKCLLYSNLKKGNLEEVKNIVKLYTQNVR
jgi:hypothetical protein